MSRLPRFRALPAALLLFLLLAAGCSSSDTDALSSGAGGSTPGGAVESADRVAPGSSALSSVPGRAAEPDGRPRLFISTGTVELRSSDVGDARADVRRVVDRYRGEVDEQQSDSDSHGRLRHARLVLRVPSADFEAAVHDLEGIATLIRSDSGAEEVTTQVIDTRVALRVQRRSVERITTLLARARTIRDIIAIEDQLARRQARLGQLEQHAAYLADQTSMSTVTVSIERRGPASAPPTDAGGFRAGLRAGWDGLVTVAVVAATAFGAALPFAAVALLLLALAWPLLRRLRHRRIGADVTPEGAESA